MESNFDESPSSKVNRAIDLLQQIQVLGRNDAESPMIEQAIANIRSGAMSPDEALEFAHKLEQGKQEH